MPRVDFLMDSIDMEVDAGTRLLDVSREIGSSIPFGCTNGVCGTCIVSLIDGDFSSLDEKREKQTLEMFGAEENHRLACQCIVESDAKIDNP